MSEWIVEIGDGNPHIKRMKELVRCKDCKWCRLYQLFGTDNYQCERNALSAYFWVEPTDYCSYGERREVQRNFNASNTLDALEAEVTE